MNHQVAQVKVLQQNLQVVLVITHQGFQVCNPPRVNHQQGVQPGTPLGIRPDTLLVIRPSVQPHTLLGFRPDTLLGIFPTLRATIAMVVGIGVHGLVIT